MNFNSLFQLDTHYTGNDDSALTAAIKILLHANGLTICIAGRNGNSADTPLPVRPRSMPILVSLEDALLNELGLTQAHFGRFVYPGDRVGVLTKEVQRMTGLGDIPVIAVAGHDTASAVERGVL